MLQSLIKALNSSNNITLPNLGGIIKMGSSFMFNEFLKFNDGKFSKFLQETDGLSKEEANIKIDNFIKEIKTALSETGSFSLNEIGTLNLIDGKIKLELLPSSTKEKEQDLNQFGVDSVVHVESGYSGYFEDIDEGEKLLCFFSPTCEHCQETGKILSTCIACIGRR